MSAPGFDWSDLIFFLELSRQGRLVPAAKRLRADHTTVSRRIAALESALHCKLFDRNSNGFMLTDAGQKLLVYAESTGLMHIPGGFKKPIQQHQDAYLKLNPWAKVPTLVEAYGPDGYRHVISQSNAIMFYTSEKAPGRLLPFDRGLERSRALERFLFFVAEVIALSHAAVYLKQVNDSRSCGELEAKAVSALCFAERFACETEFIAGNPARPTRCCSLHKGAWSGKTPTTSSAGFGIRKSSIRAARVRPMRGQGSAMTRLGT